MLQPRKMRYDKAGPVVAENLKKRHFDAYYCSTREEAITKVLELIPAEDVVSWGGTMTVDELGIKGLLAQRGQKLLDRDTAKDMPERMAIMRAGLTCDTFLTGTKTFVGEYEINEKLGTIELDFEDDSCSLDGDHEFSQDKEAGTITIGSTTYKKK